VTRYAEALRWLYGLESRGIKLGLERMTRAAEVRAHPEAGLQFVHIAGTNGKGSVAALLESVLRAAGYRTGQFASPHLQRYVERVRIEGRPISERAAAQRIEALRHDPRLPELSFFEYTTLLAFEAFAEAKCDIVLLEVGLGGRLDATNIVTPVVSVISNIGLEHERILGDTLAKIAREKAGVLKPGVTCVSGVTQSTARAAITKRANLVGAPLVRIGRDFSSEWRNGKLWCTVGDHCFPDLRLGLQGRHQASNAACAVAALQELRRMGFVVSDRDLRLGFRRVKWPGRLEWHRGNPTFLFDAAHNAAGCRSLAAYLENERFPGRVVLLFGAMKDKNHRQMLGAFDDVVDRRVYVASKMRRVQEPSSLARIRGGTVARSVRDGLRIARRMAGPNGLVLVAGSIFVVAEVRGAVKGVRTDPPIAM